MKKIVIFLIMLSSLQASSTLTCKNYNEQAVNIVGKSPPSNMMLQSIRAYKFPQKISKKDEAFKKLASIESLVNKNVDLVVLWNSKQDYSALASKLQKVNIDTCTLKLESIYDYIEAYLVMGKIMDKEQRATTLSNYIKEKLNYIENIKKDIPLNKQVSVYYAKGANGLESECENSLHTEVIQLIGAKNPIQCSGVKNMKVNINLEKLLLLNPDVIITKDKNFVKKLFSEAKYKSLKAVSNKRVYKIPTKPINWIDNPPSFFKILGALWLGQTIYPEYYTYDLEAEKENFFKLFLQQGKL